jgi:hypothetical protein
VEWAFPHLRLREEDRAIHRYVLEKYFLEYSKDYCSQLLFRWLILLSLLYRTVKSIGSPLSYQITRRHWSLSATVAFFLWASWKILSHNQSIPIANKDNPPQSSIMATMANNDRESTQPTCQNCTTSTTPLWRRDEIGSVLCNACGLFLKLHGRPRPISLKTDVIKSRNRVKSSGATQGAKKKVSPGWGGYLFESDGLLTRRGRRCTKPMAWIRCDRRLEHHLPDLWDIVELHRNLQMAILKVRTPQSRVRRLRRCSPTTCLPSTAILRTPTTITTPRLSHPCTFEPHRLVDPRLH